jgi:hypothetical protein
LEVRESAKHSENGRRPTAPFFSLLAQRKEGKRKDAQEVVVPVYGNGHQLRLTRNRAAQGKPETRGRLYERSEFTASPV